MKIPNVPSEGFLKALPDSERKKLGKAGMTREEAQAVYLAGQEREFKKHALNLLNLRRAYVFEQGMHKRTGGKRGTPDIIGCHKSYFFAIELKVSGNTLSDEQAVELQRIRGAGGFAIVAYRLRDIQALLDAIDLL